MRTDQYTPPPPPIFSPGPNAQNAIAGTEARKIEHLIKRMCDLEKVLIEILCEAEVHADRILGAQLKGANEAECAFAVEGSVGALEEAFERVDGIARKIAAEVRRFASL